MSLRSLAVLDGGKYLAKIFSTNPSQLVMDSLGKVWSQPFARSLSEKGNSLSLIASSITPLDLKVSQTSKKLAMWALGSSLDKPSS